MIIALESASSDPSIALAAPDGTAIASDGWSAAGRQGSELLPRLLLLLAGEGRELHGATAIAVGIGPGSFTGLRVAMSLAKGLAMALAIPVSGVPSLEAWLVGEPGTDAAVARAGARDAFVLVRGDADPRVVSTVELSAVVAGRRVVAPTEVAEAFQLVDAVPPHRAAAAVAATAAARLAIAPAGDDLERLEPAYLRAARGIGPPGEVASWP